MDQNEIARRDRVVQALRDQVEIRHAHLQALPGGADT